MIEIPEIEVAIPSYRRPKVETLKYIPWARVYVSEVEADAYRAENPGAAIVAVDPKHQGNLCRIRNHIMDVNEEAGRAVCIVDDDLRSIQFIQDAAERLILPREEIGAFLEKYTLMAIELGAYLWGINVNGDTQNYRQYTPFSLTSYIGGPFMVHLPGGGIRFDERLPLKEDYDFTLQHLNRHRKTLRINRFYYTVRQVEQSGGCASYRSMKAEKEQFDLLQRKWGSGIIKYDKGGGGRVGRDRLKDRKWDINPIMKAPIRGV